VIKLRFLTGPLADRVVDLDGETVLGRGEVDLVVEDEEVSRRHLAVRSTESGWEVEDLGSLNGTFLNGIPLAAPRPLRQGDRLELGDTQVQVEEITTASEAGPPEPTPGSALAEALPVGTRLGPYEVLEVIKRGSMSAVYKGYQPSLDRFVAVKVLLQTDDEQFVARFRQEARAIGHLQHPNILPVFDHGEHDGILYLVTQYIDNGVTLADFVGEPMEPIRALQLTTQVLGALSYAHGRSVVHRDVKPSNILLPLPSWPMLADFGIAKILQQHDQRQITQYGLIVGTAAYISPEQALSRPVDGRSDIYSAGVLLFELLTGRLPFEADSPMEMMAQHAYASPPKATAANPGLSPQVDALLLKALAKDPGDRFSTAGDMATAVNRLAEGLARAGHGDQLTGTYHQGIIAFTDGRWSEAIDQLTRVIESDPDYEDAHHLLEAAKEARDSGTQPAPP
jgi:serine/threonine protein kinase